MSIRRHLQKYLAEAMGNFFLVGTISLLGNPDTGVGPNPLVGPIAVGCVLMALIYAMGHVSSAHYNPAVTAVQLVRRDIRPVDAGMYVVAQLIGGVVGGIFGALIADDANVVGYPRPTHAKPGAVLRAFGAEVFFTCALMLVILHVAAKQQGNPFFGIAIAAVVVAGAITTGPVSGAVFNPAVASGLVLRHCVVTHERTCGTAVQGLWLYWVAPTLGAAIGAVLFTLMTTVPEDDDMPESAGAARQRRERMCLTAEDDCGDDDRECLRVDTGSHEPSDPKAGDRMCLRARGCSTVSNPAARDK
uniref:Aquaporin n=1 Tax=Neobodo designis TaxID=312471 RepID=A0A7S1QPE3_NEODS|mmetsp:Transcript_49737/g.153710  ORF Transcript_49737/g.153710 Transcript_49737/m.153710 type:complete len:303 (+) Transcript_49737:38-946(+)